MALSDYEMESVPMFSGWVGSWDRSGVHPPVKKKGKKKKKGKDTAPFGFHVREKEQLGNAH